MAFSVWHFAIRWEVYDVEKQASRLIVERSAHTGERHGKIIPISAEEESDHGERYSDHHR